MSLIQEALKRQQEEAKKAGATDGSPVVQQPLGQEPPVARTSGLQMASATPSPSVEQEAPPIATEEAAEPSKFADKRLLGLVLKIVPLALVLIGGGVWIAKSMLSAKPPQVATSTAKSPAPSASQPTTAQPAVEPPKTAPTQPGTNSQSAAVLSNSATIKHGDTPTNQEPEESAPAIVEPVQPPASPAPLVWPALTVNAIIGKDKNGAAKINNVLMDVGQEIDGVTLISVGKQSVQLEYRGQQRTIKIGRSTQ